MKTTSLLLTSNQLTQLKEQLKNVPLRYDIAYTQFQAKLHDGTITAYTSGKVVFSGPTAHEIMAPFETIVDEINEDMAGSDEVGTGDYFGPITVVACFVKATDVQWLRSFKIMDSKAMTDTKIWELGPILQEKLTHSLLILENSQYNVVHQTKNLNAIKAMMHHKAYSNLKEKLGFLPSLSVVDQFMDPVRYYEVLDDDYGIDHLHFETKAESKYLAVACASVIARYSFLLAMKQLSEHYQFEFPLGAGAQVDIKGRELLRRYPNLDLNKVAKVHYKNTSRILDSIQP